MDDATKAAAKTSSNALKLNLISAHMFLRVAVGCQGLAAEPLFVGALCQGDASAAMQLLAQSSGACGLLQFLLNPTFGVLSDTFGRKVFFVLGPLSNVIGNTMIALNPTSKAVFFVCRTINKTMQTVSGSTVCAAALSDCASGDDLSVAFSRLGSAASLGVVLGPLMGAAMLGRNFTPSAVYWMQVGSGLIHSLLLVGFLQEVRHVFPSPPHTL